MITYPIVMKIHTPAGAITQNIETTHGESQSQSILTHTLTEDKIVYCKFTIGDLTAIKSFDVDIFGKLKHPLTPRLIDLLID